jgi:hypothetical protein
MNCSSSVAAAWASSSRFAVSGFIDRLSLPVDRRLEVGIADRALGDEVNRAAEELLERIGEIEIPIRDGVIVFPEIDDEIEIARLGRILASRARPKEVEPLDAIPPAEGGNLVSLALYLRN